MRAVLLLVACLAVATAALAAPEAPTAVKWATKYAAAQAAAAESGKPIMLVLYTSRLVVCASGPVAPDPFKGSQVIALSDKFSCVRLDADKHTELAEKYHKYDFPAALFLSSKGDLAYDSMVDLSAEAFLVRMNAALEALKALPERQELEAARDAGTATPDDLAKLGHLLLLAGRDADAAAVLTEALAGLPADAAAKSQADLDELMAAAATKGPEARTALVEWIAANGDNPRRWEAEHKLAVAQQKGNARQSALQSHTEVSKGDPQSDWGVLSTYYAQAITAQLKYEANPPVG